MAEDIDIGDHHFSLELSFSSNDTVRLLATTHPSQLKSNIRIGGASTLVASGSRRTVNAILPADGRIDREGFGQAY